MSSRIGKLGLAILRGYSRIAATDRGAFHAMASTRRLLPRERWRGWYTTPSGLRLELDLGTYPDCCMAVGLYELHLERLLRRLLKPGDWFVDCGANIGYFTLLGARQVGPAGRVDAFEPDPENRARLEANLSANGVGDVVRVHSLALGAAEGTLDLYHPAGTSVNHGRTTAYAGLVAEATKHTVRCVPLDAQLEDVPDLIKLDLEGGELSAIEGMAGLLSSDSPPRLIAEHNRQTASAAGYRPSDIHRKLTALQPRYRVYWIGRRLVPIVSPEKLDDLPRQGNLLASTESQGTS